MTGTGATWTAKKLRTPRAAAVAGILFAILFGTSLALLRLATPAAGTATDSAWLESNRSSVELALNLLPIAGIAFLWFIGVIRDRLGDMEDRLFASVLLGSGLMFLAMVFVGGAMAGGVLSSYASIETPDQQVEVIMYGRSVMFQLVNIYAIRMAGVFMISLGTIWLRTGLMHRVWAFITYVLALVLLFSISYSLWVILIFPAWVFAVSVFFLIVSFRSPDGETSVAF